MESDITQSDSPFGGKTVEGGGMEYRELNLGLIEAIVDRLGGIEDVKKIISGELVVRVKKAIGDTVYRLLVNYDLKVEDLVKKGKYDAVEGGIYSNNFPTEKSGKKIVEMKLFHFDKEMTSEEAIFLIEKTGYRPADAHETLTFGIKNLGKRKRSFIVGLGSVWGHTINGGSVVTLRNGTYHGRKASPGYFGNGWEAEWRFLVVRD